MNAMKICDYCGSMSADDNAKTCSACGGTFQITKIPEAKQDVLLPISGLSPRKIPKRWLGLAVIVLAALVLVISLLTHRTAKTEANDHQSLSGQPSGVSERAMILELKEQVNAAHDNESVLRIAKRNWEYFSKDETLTQAYDAAALGYQKEILDEAREEYKKSGYASALSTVNKGLSLLPDDPSLKYYYELYMSCTPKSFGDLTVLDDNSFYNGNYSVTDPFGEVHTGNTSRFIMDYFTEKASVDIVLNAKYSTLDFSYFVDKYKAQLCIYTDDIPVFDSGVFEKTNGTNTVSISVENTRVLRIETISHSEISVVGDLDTSNVYIVDTKLERKLTDAELMP